MHRDVKPANIPFDADGHAVVTDFGLALVTSRSTAEAMADGSGTPHYMSPEQALGEAVDGRSDVYASSALVRLLLDDSPEPRLAATGDAVPPALVAAARSRGLLRPDEVVRFAFVPSEERAGDALLVTDEAMVRLRDLAACRYLRGQLDVTFYTSRGVDTDTTNALLVVTPTGGTPDTLYHRLHGRDVLRLSTALYSLRRRAPR